MRTRHAEGSRRGIEILMAAICLLWGLALTRQFQVPEASATVAAERAYTESDVISTGGLIGTSSIVETSEEFVKSADHLVASHYSKTEDEAALP